MLHGGRRVCHSAAYKVAEFPGSKATSMAPVLSSWNRILCQLVPPSFERKTPRSEFGPYACPSAATKILLGSCGSTRILPICLESRKPACVHVFPASADRYIPSPLEIDERISASPDPT